MRKHDVFEGHGLKHSKTRVLEASRMEPGGKGAGLLRLGKTAFWHVKTMFYQGSGYFFERPVGAGL